MTRRQPAHWPRSAIAFAFAAAALYGVVSATVAAADDGVHAIRAAPSTVDAANGPSVAFMLGLWESALQDIRQGAPRAALPRLERLVSAAPGETRYRLELARTLFLIGVDERARYHFGLALGDPTLSPAEVAVVERYLDRIAARSAWSGRFSFAIVPESNPGQRTRAQTVTIGGLPFRINPEGRAQSGTGVEFGGHLQWTPRLAQDVRGRLQVSAWQELYETADFNDLMLRGAAGVDLLGDRGRELGLAVTYQRRWVADQPFSHGPGLEVSFARRFGQANRGWVRANVTDLRHDNLARRDGLRLYGAAGAIRAVTQRFVANASVFASASEAQADFERYRELGAGLGGRYAVRGGAVLGLQGWAAQRRYEAPFPFLTDARDETRWGVTVTATHRDASWNNFAPEVRLTYETRNSNIPLYDYSNTSLSIGVTRAF